MTIEYVTLKTLRIAPENMRKTAAESDLGELIASISAEGLLQNLVGYRDGDDTVAITAGGRRLRAPNALAADKSSKAFRRSEERRAGKERVRTCRARGSRVR